MTSPRAATVLTILTLLTLPATLPAQRFSRWSWAADLGLGRIGYTSVWYRTGFPSTTQALTLGVGLSRGLSSGLALRASTRVTQTDYSAAVPVCLPGGSSQNLPDPGGCSEIATSPGTLVEAAMEAVVSSSRVSMSLGGGSVWATNVGESQANRSWAVVGSVDARVLRFGNATVALGGRGFRVTKDLAGARWAFLPNLTVRW